MAWPDKRKDSSKPQRRRPFSSGRPDTGPGSQPGHAKGHGAGPKPNSAKKHGTSWEQSATWYDKIIGPQGSELYQNVVIPQGLALLKPVAGESILDLGCGQGVFSRSLAELGCEVTGVDLAPSLIAKAKTYPSKTPIRYFTRDASKIRDLGPFDAASAILCLQNMPHLTDVCHSCAAVLKPGGRMLWVMNHPCFRIPKQTSWGFDEVQRIQYRRLDAYGSPLKIPIIMHPGQPDSETTQSFHLSMMDLTAKAFAAGLVLAGLQEFYSFRESEPGPRAKAENKARKEFPLFLGLLWRKV